MKPLVLLLAVAFAAGVRAQAPDPLPPINTPATNQSLQGKVIWADLHTADPAAAIKFYTGLFGWTATTLQRANHSYTVFLNDGHPVAGVALRPVTPQDQGRGRWVTYLAVADVPRTLAIATANGGRVLVPAKDLPNRGVQALLADNEGGIFGVLHSSSGDPEDYQPEIGDWAWAHVSEPDPAAAAAFYQTVLGYPSSPDPERAGAFILGAPGMARTAIGPIPARPDARPGWLIFVRVADAGQSAARAEALGGHILVAPKSTRPGSRLAVVSDPVDGTIGLIELEEGSVQP